MSQHPNAASSSSNTGKLQLWLTIALSTAILITLLFSAGASRADKHPGQGERALANVASIEMQTSYQREHKIFGLVESASTSHLGFEQSGRLATIQVEEGDRVKQGQVLATLDTSSLQSRRTELEAGLQRAQADVQLARATLTRLESVLAKGGSSQQQVDEARARFAVASAQVTETQAALSSLKVEINKSSLLAPFDGMVGARLVDEGTVVPPASPILTLGATYNLQARLAMPQALASTLVIGQKLAVNVGEEQVNGAVLSIQPTRNRQTRTVDILVALPDASSFLLMGDMVSVSLNTQVEESGAWVPLSSLSQGVRGLWSLLVVSADDSDDTKLQSRLVEIVYATNTQAFVRGAIASGDKYVLSGGQRLVPGQLVRVTLVNNASSGASL